MFKTQKYGKKQNFQNYEGHVFFDVDVFDAVESGSVFTESGIDIENEKLQCGRVLVGGEKTDGCPFYVPARSGERHSAVRRGSKPDPIG